MNLPVELLMLHDEHFIDDDELMLLYVATSRKEIDHRGYARINVLNRNPVASGKMSNILDITKLCVSSLLNYACFVITCL